MGDLLKEEFDDYQQNKLLVLQGKSFEECCLILGERKDEGMASELFRQESTLFDQNSNLSNHQSLDLINNEEDHELSE